MAFDAMRTRIDVASAAIEREVALISDEARIRITSPERGFPWRCTWLNLLPRIAATDHN